MTKYCICQICNCGRHHCPLHSRGPLRARSSGPCPITEYAQRYREHPLQATKTAKPDATAFRSDQPLDNKTTHRVDFIKHPLERPHVHQSEDYKPPEGDFEGMTNYRKDFDRKQINRAKPMKPADLKKSLGPFKGEPTYRTDYRKWPMERNLPIMKSDYSPPDAKFEGLPTYKKDYVKYNEPPRQSMKPLDVAKGSDHPFDDRTGYRDHYIKHPLPEKEIKEKEMWKPNKAPLDGLSNYKKDYTEKFGGPTASCKPDASAFQSGAPLEDTTTHRNDFKKWDAERPYVHEPDQYRKPEGDIELYTTHKTDFTKKPLAKPKSMRPVDAKKVPGAFDDKTNYREDFKKWNMEREKPVMKPDYSPPEAPFEGLPTYKKDYVKYNEPPRQSMKPLDVAKGSDHPFDDRTGYRDHYIKHPLPEKEIKHKEAWQPNKAPLDGLSNYKKDYTEKFGGPTASCKPDASAFQSGAPLEDTTTHRNDFKKWDAERPFVHEPDQYRKPEGDIELYTTHKTDFTKKPLAKPKSMRPVDAKKVPGAFDDKTNYREDFKKWNMEREKPVMKPDYSPPEAPFEGLPTYKKDYVKYNEAPRKSMRPSEGGIRSDAPFDDQTMYRTEYVKKQSDICPAAILDTTQSKYSYRDQDDIGHKWYEPLNGKNAMTSQQIGRTYSASSQMRTNEGLVCA
ncbi:DgyrCDS8255 [Dimorphilus gyrociliatus]|uniref:DgyrCDS8255 n=1 Tax=Dimorphilus gyrociliatus TaxID=2664684 RepID=A0A7I8VVU4_9ANNE|nr:DgyrCDS8255 [Dimorphilus gyrociliatus]